MNPIRTLLAGLSALLLLVSCASSPETPQVDQDTDSTVAQNAIVEEEPQIEILWLITKKTVLYSDGSVDKTITWEFDDLGRPLDSVESDSQGNITYHRKWTYDAEGVLSLELFDDVGLLSVTLYENDSEGRVVEEIQQDVEGAVLSSIVYVYDQDGRLASSMASDGSGAPRLKTVYTYRGNQVSQIEFQLPNGTLEASVDFVFDESRVMEEIVSLPDGTIETKTTFEYEGDQLLGETYYQGSAKTKSVSFEVDEYGNVLRESWMNRTGRVFEEVEYEWIQIEVME